MWLSDTVLSHVRGVIDEPDLSGTRYVLGERLGKGGMGTVWAATDTQLDREVALKVSVAMRGDGIAERLEREAKVIARLEHPGIVPVHDAGELPDGRVFYVMKRVRGARLDAWAKGHDLRARLKLFQRICEAVAFAHARGVLHRDLKPENVMVGEFGEALVMDWGLAKVGATDSEPSAAASPAGDTQAGVVLGTPGYMAPEQARGEPATLASDVFGLGAILRVLLGEGAPVPLAAIRDKATAAEPAGRYAGASELGDDVGRFLDQEPVAARRETVIERAARFASKNRIILSLVAAYLLVRVVLFLLPR